MQMFTEEELCFERVKGVGFIAMVKRVRTVDLYDDWYVVDQIETCDGYRKRTTRTHGCIADADDDYQNRLAHMKAKAAKGFSKR